MSNRELYHHGILGMKWGVRHYQNKDGTLTLAGQKRYGRDVRENLSKKKDNRIDTSNPDPKRWTKEDLERSRRTVDASAKLVNQFSEFERETAPKPVKKKLDLSSMTNKEMQDRINRELLEQQYNRLFEETTQPEISKGRKYVNSVLNVAGSTLAVTSSALGIALAIKELRG